MLKHKLMLPILSPADPKELSTDKNLFKEENSIKSKVLE